MHPIPIGASPIYPYIHTYIHTAKIYAPDRSVRSGEGRDKSPHITHQKMKLKKTMYVCLDLISSDVNYFFGGGGEQIIYLVRVPVELCIYVLSIRERVVVFFFFPPFGDTSIFFLSFFEGVFFGEREEGEGRGGAYVGLCVGWGWGGVFIFLNSFS